MTRNRCNKAGSAQRRSLPSARLRATVAAAVLTVLVGAFAAPVAADPGHGSEPGETTAETIVVRFDQSRPSPALLDQFGLRLDEPLLESRGIWQVELTQLAVSPDQANDEAIDSAKGKKIKQREPKDVAKELAKADGVLWAELEGDRDRRPEDDRFHAWPEGLPSNLGADPELWLRQPNLDALQLDRVHQRATGEGVVVAILDTGVDLEHPSLQAHLGSGHYDYVDDDDDPTEEGNGIDDDGDGHIDESYGHGTHAAGLVALVAPDAEILVYRVLDADGRGHPIVIAQAIEDAIDAGAEVINISFGMEGKPDSKVLREAFKTAKRHEVSVVAAVGNDSRDSDQYPAGEKEVLGVAAMANGNRELANFSNYGKRAVVAAPGEDIVSTLPGGDFGAWSGTSMATPIVAGQVALVRSGSDGLKAKKVVEIVGHSAIKIKGKRKIEKGLIDILRSIDD